MVTSLLRADEHRIQGREASIAPTAAACTPTPDAADGVPTAPRPGGCGGVFVDVVTAAAPGLKPVPVRPPRALSLSLSLSLSHLLALLLGPCTMPWAVSAPTFTLGCGYSGEALSHTHTHHSHHHQPHQTAAPMPSVCISRHSGYRALPLKSPSCRRPRPTAFADVL